MRQSMRRLLMQSCSRVVVKVVGGDEEEDDELVDRPWKITLLYSGVSSSWPA